MNPTPIDLDVLLRERDERLRAAGLLPARSPRRLSLEVRSDLRRGRR